MANFRARKRSNIIIVRSSHRPEQIGGIFLPPESSTVSSQFVAVVSRGDGITDDEKRAMSTLKKDDVLLVERNAGHVFDIDGEQYLAIDIGQVYGKVDGINRRI